MRAIALEIPIPLNAWTTTSNRLFYNGAINPLGVFRTLGSADPLLPEAFAKELSSHAGSSIHEIGPGNFLFALRVLYNSPTLSRYNTYDMSDSSYKLFGDSLPAKIVFNHIPANSVRQKIEGKSNIILGVELCDDLPHEYWSYHEGQTYEVWIDVDIDSRVQGIVGKAIQTGGMAVIAENKPELRANAQDLADILATGRWDELNKYDPGFLKSLHYKTHQLMPFELSRIYETSFSDMPDEFKKIGDQILIAYHQQLKLIKEPAQVVHLPVGAIKLLWQFRDLEDSSIHFFDYGYGSDQVAPSAFVNYQGQLTTAVNFGLLKTAAEIMGYKVLLEKDREFINRKLDEDTFIIGRIRGLDLNTEKQLLKHFAAPAARLRSGSEPDEYNIRALRVRRIDIDEVAAKLNKSWNYIDGSYHFCAST